MHDRDLKGSQQRLWTLVEQRCQPGADVKEIDQRIWDLFGEEWAVMFTDLSGFSRRVQEFGIIHFLQVIHEQRKILLPIVERHDGLLLKEEGDDAFLERTALIERLTQLLDGVFAAFLRDRLSPTWAKAWQPALVAWVEGESVPASALKEIAAATRAARRSA